MNILFVCYSNIGRSQTAQALYNYWTNTEEAHSAGTGVDKSFPECKTLGDFEKYAHHRPSTLTVMSEKFGLNLDHLKRAQLTPEMLSQYDLVVNIADRNQTPDWFRGDNVIWWQIEDLGPNFSRERAFENFDMIADKVKRLIEVEKTDGDFHKLDDNIDAEDK